MPERVGSNFDQLRFSKRNQLRRAPKPARTALQKERYQKRRRVEANYLKTKRVAAQRDHVRVAKAGYSGLCRCGCGSTKVQTHHHTKRGMGGGSRDDSTGNLVTLDWRKCHRQADAGTLTLAFLNKRLRADGRIRFELEGRRWVT